jgi:hypothetical protein
MRLWNVPQQSTRRQREGVIALKAARAGDITNPIQGENPHRCETLPVEQELLSHPRQE